MGIMENFYVGGLCFNVPVEFHFLYLIVFFRTEWHEMMMSSFIISKIVMHAPDSK